MLAPLQRRPVNVGCAVERQAAERIRPIRRLASIVLSNLGSTTEAVKGRKCPPAPGMRQLVCNTAVVDTPVDRCSVNVTRLVKDDIAIARILSALRPPSERIEHGFAPSADCTYAYACCRSQLQ